MAFAHCPPSAKADRIITMDAHELIDSAAGWCCSIRRYYKGEDSPLYRTLVQDKDFFDLFVDFRGYVDYFFLQDCVSDDYSEVVRWIGNKWFDKNPLPKSVEEYLKWIDLQMEFLQKRNMRIANAYSGELT